MPFSSWLLLLSASVSRLGRTPSACGVVQYETLPKVCVSNLTMAVTGLLERRRVSLSATQLFLLSRCSRRTYKKPTHDITAVVGFTSRSLQSRWPGRDRRSTKGRAYLHL